MDLLIALHDALSHRLLRPAYELGRGLARRHRLAYRAYREGLRFRRASAVWSLARRDEWVLARLRNMLRYAYASTAFYRERWDAIGFDPRADFDWSDFARLPVLTRADVHEHGAALRSTAVPDWEVERNATGGSSGRPVEIWMGPVERGWRASGAEYSMRRLGVGHGVRRALLWGHHLDPVQREGLLDRVLDLLANRRWYDCFRLSPERLLAYDRDLRRYRPRCMVAYASALAALAAELERRGAPPPPYPSVCFVTGAEKLYDDQRALIERVFRRPVHERYGSRDVGDMGFQYLESGSRHYDVDWALVLLEPETAETEAPILVTKLHGDGMPMIRYAVDDIGRFPPGAVPGRPTYRLEAVVGRKADRIMLPQGGWVHGIHFPHLLKDFPLRDFQVRQAADYGVTVRLVAGPAFSEAHRRAIEANLRANLPGLSVTCELVDAVPRTPANKWRPVISEVGG
ncbi:MAG TPA: hypothetical protein VNJ71_10415 [Gemmatimonadales bacterium]|nr:hypothetical protein [Gemmatimonadales bacterium]